MVAVGARQVIIYRSIMKHLFLFATFIHHFLFPALFPVSASQCNPPRVFITASTIITAHTSSCPLLHSPAGVLHFLLQYADVHALHQQCERLVDVASVLSTGFDERDVVLISQVFPLPLFHSSLAIQVRLVSDKDKVHRRICVCPHILNPLANIIE